MKAIDYDGGKDVAFQPYAASLPGDIVSTKNVNSSFIGTSLEQVICNRGIIELVVARMTADRWVSTSVHMAANLSVLLGRVVLLSDAMATYECGIGQLGRKMMWDAEIL